MKIYVDENEKYKDTESTAWAFGIVGVGGFILLALIYTGLFPIAIDTERITTLTFAIVIMCAIFLFISVKSFLELKSIKKRAAEQDNVNEEVKNYILENYKEEILASGLYSDESIEEHYLALSSHIGKLITDKYSKLSEETLDHITEEIYDEIFKDNK